MTTDGQTLQIYYSRENSGIDQDIIMQTSKDGGASWSNPQTIIGQGSNDKRDGMVGIAPVSGTNLIAVYETNKDNQYTINAVTSPDDGATWATSETRVYTASGYNNSAGSPQVVAAGGTLVASFMTDEDSPQHNWPMGANTKVLTSTDGGQNWGESMLVGPVQSNWPGMVALDEVSVLVMYENSGAVGRMLSLG